MRNQEKNGILWEIMEKIILKKNLPQNIHFFDYHMLYTSENLTYML